MKRFKILFLTILVLASFGGKGILSAQTLDQKIPIRGFAIEAPSQRGVDLFVRFIEEDLATAKINLLILRVDWNFDYKSHPELRDEHPLTQEDVDKLVAACRKHNIRLVPQVNLLGHQSWAKETHALLREYPQFDETPSISVENYSHWPNPYRLYCKSYCPLHPDVHKVVFDVVDEICDAFQADAFHAGMDEVFYIGEDECPRCAGKDKSELFAGEVTTIHDHLAEKGRQLMIWGDRLLDGRTTGLGEWEASYNDTWRAIDMIPKDVLICDWHYERADLSPVYFAMKGLPVVSCGYRDPAISLQQVKDMMRFRTQTPKETREHLQGYVHTIWSSAGRFLFSYYGMNNNRPPRQGNQGGNREGNREPRRDGSVDAARAVLTYFREQALSEKYETEHFQTPTGETVGITLIKHGSLEIHYKGLSFQVDPVSGLNKPTDYAAEFPKADYILITHEHGDHLDKEAVAALRRENTVLITNARCVEMLGWGKVMANGDQQELREGIRLEAVPAYNYSEGRQQFHPKGRDNGFILTLDGLRIYIAGDTEDIPEMAQLKDIDIAFLPVNQPYTMTAEQCVKAAQTIAPKVLIPYHFGQTDLSSLPTLLSGIDVRLREMQ